MDTRDFKVEKTDKGFWAFIHRSSGDLPQDPLHKTLEWVLEQLNIGNIENERDVNGDIVSMRLGREASQPWESMDAAAEAAANRFRAVNYAGLLAEGREKGVEASFGELSSRASRSATEWALINTEFYYAFELTKVLARLNKKAFNLEAPPILGIASPTVVSYLQESTRCWLYGFHGASVALSRACLEDMLKQCTQIDKISLDDLIEEAKGFGVLDDCTAQMAHSIRVIANKFLHGSTITQKESRDSLDAIRFIADHVFSA